VTNDAALPFAGLHVADFSWVGVGPLTAKYLADHGATTVRVETAQPPDILRVNGPFADGVFGANRSHFFGMFNSSKLSIALNLKHPAGQAVARRLIAWAGSVSPAAAALVEQMLASRPHPEHATPACLGLMSLGRKYGHDRLGAACERALATRAISYSSVKSILAENLDRLPLPDAPQAPAPAAHDNLRGADYWAQTDQAGEGC